MDKLLKLALASASSAGAFYVLRGRVGEDRAAVVAVLGGMAAGAFVASSDASKGSRSIEQGRSAWQAGQA